MLIYPVADERMETESMKKYTDTPMWNAEHNAEMWRMYLEGKTCPEASPMEMELPKQLPLTYMEVAELDCLHDEGVAYAGGWKKRAERWSCTRSRACSTVMTWTPAPASCRSASATVRTRCGVACGANEPFRGIFRPK